MSNEEHGKDTVPIEMDGADFSIHRGRQPVEHIKETCHVNPNWVIELIGADGQLTLLDNGGSLVIHGGERFLSHVPGGGSSWC